MKILFGEMYRKHFGEINIGDLDKYSEIQCTSYHLTAE